MAAPEPNRHSTLKIVVRGECAVERNKYLFGLLGLIFGITLGFFGTRYINQSAAGTTPGTQATGAMGAGGQGGQGGQGQEAQMASVRDTIEKAKKNPDDFDAQLGAAKTYFQIGRTTEAIEYLEKAYKIQPDNINVTANLGILHSEEKNYPEAEKWFRRALELDPQEDELYVELGATFIQRKPPEPDKAIEEIDRALKIKPKNGHALGHLIEAYILKKDAQMAENTLNRLKEAEPNNDRISIYQNLVSDLKAGKAVTLPEE